MIAEPIQALPGQAVLGRFSSWLERLDGFLRRQSRFSFVGWAVLLALALSLGFYAPRLQVLAHEQPGSFEWARGLDFMRQCESPFAITAHDPALRWRLLPAVACHVLGLRGHAVFVFPWLGVLLLLAQTALLIEARTADRGLALLTTGVLTTTSGIWTPTTWLGINDAWYLSALVGVAFARSPAGLALAAFAGPWADERFVIGLPLALLLRSAEDATGSRRRLALPVAGVILYLVVRLVVSSLSHDATAQAFVGGALRECWTWLPWAPLGWFFGFRAAWLIIVAAIAGLFLTARRETAAAVVIVAVGSLLVLTFLAADLTRATPILLPLLFVGVMSLATWLPVPTARVAVALVLGTNLLMPALHVTYTKVSLLSPLPVEIVRLARKAAAPY